MNAQDVIESLKLECHVEGGWYRRTFLADEQTHVEQVGGERFLMSSIYYLLTTESPVGHWHRNASDIVHYFHLGNPLRYHLLHEDGRYETAVMGVDLAAGECLQLQVKGGVWKASELLGGSSDFGLISEAVTPGWDARDMQLGNLDTLRGLFPEREAVLRRFVRG